jgi:heterodisulfide reductase subunit D
MTQLDRQGPSDPVSVPFTPGMRDNPEELAVIPDEIARAHELPSEPTPTQEFTEKWRNAAYDCFSSGNKFCREVCPVTQVTRNESWTPTAFPANVVAMDKSEMTIEDIASDYVNCTQCGACELRCPNTLFTGDFDRFRARTVDVVKAVRVRRRERSAPAGVEVVERAHGRAHPRAGAGRDPGQPGARARLVRRARPDVRTVD